MTIKSRIEKLEHEGGYSEICTCPTEEITPGMDTKEATRIYYQAANCGAHRTPTNRNAPKMSPEEATRIYEKFKNECRIDAT